MPCPGAPQGWCSRWFLDDLVSPGHVRRTLVSACWQPACMLKQPTEELELAVVFSRKSFNLYTFSGSRSICLPKSDTRYWPQVWGNSSRVSRHSAPDIGSRGKKKSVKICARWRSRYDCRCQLYCWSTAWRKKNSASLHLCCNATSQLGQDYYVSRNLWLSLVV